MQVTEVTEYSPEVLVNLKQLLPQLSKNAALPSGNLARKIVESDATRLLFARERELVMGMLTIVIFLSPLGFEHG